MNYPRHNHGEIDDYILSRCFDKLYDEWYYSDPSELAYKHDSKAVPGINYRSPWSLSLFQIVSCDSQVYKGEKRDIYCAMSRNDNPDAVSEVEDKIEANRGIFRFIEYLTSRACSLGRAPDTEFWDEIMPRDERNEYLPVPKDQQVAIRQRGDRPGAVRADVYYINPDPAHKLRLRRTTTCAGGRTASWTATARPAASGSQDRRIPVIRRGSATETPSTSFKRNLHDAPF